MRKSLLYFSASILLGAALVFNTSAQSEKQASETISRATMDDSGMGLHTKYINSKGHEPEGIQPSPLPCSAGKSINLYFEMENQNDDTFEGQYGFAIFKAYYMINSTQTALKPKSEYEIEAIIYESPSITIAKGESFTEKVLTEPLPYTKADLPERQIFPIFKEKGGEWKIVGTSFPELWVAISRTDLTLNSEITSSAKEVNIDQEFTVSAKVSDNRDAANPEDVKVGLFIANPTVGRPVAPSFPDRNYDFFTNINYDRKGDTFYCKVPDNIPSGKYILAIHINGVNSIANGYSNEPQYAEAIILKVNNPTIESRFDYASLSFDLWSTDPELKNQYKTGSGIKYIKTNTNSVGVDTQGQWGVAISKKANREDIDPDTDMVVLHESEVMTLAPNSSYNIGNEATNPIPSAFGDSQAYLYPIFRANASEQWYLSKKPLAINVKKEIEDEEPIGLATSNFRWNSDPSITTSPMERYAGQQVKLFFDMKNENERTFEGQYGFALFKAYYMINSTQMGKKPKREFEIQTIIYEGSSISVASGEAFSDSILTNPLPSEIAMLGDMSIFPIFKEKDGEWQIIGEYFPDIYAYIRYSDIVLNSEITSTSDKLMPNEEFVVTAFAVDNRADAKPEDMKIGLFYKKKTPSRTITTFGVNYFHAGNLDCRREGEKFYCKIPDNVPSGEYFLKVYTTDGSKTIFPEEVNGYIPYRNELKIEFKNNKIEEEFYQAHFWFDFSYHDQSNKHQYFVGNGIRNLFLYTSSAGVKTEGQWGVAITKKSEYSDIDPKTDMLVIYESPKMELQPEISYAMDTLETAPIPLEYANARAYLRPIFRENDSEQWRLVSQHSFPISVLGENLHLMDYVEIPANIETIYQDQILEIYAPIYEPAELAEDGIIVEYAVAYFENYRSPGRDLPLFIMEGTYIDNVFKVKLPSNATQNYEASFLNGTAIVYRENGGAWKKLPATNKLDYNGKKHDLSSESATHNLILSQNITIDNETAHSLRTLRASDNMMVNAVYTNIDSDNFDGTIAVFIEKGTESYIIGQIDVTNLASSEIRTTQIECSLPTNASDGNYQLSIVARSNNSDEWQEVLQETTEVQSNIEISVRSVTGIEDAENDQTLSVYPNPVVDVLNIKSERSMQSVELYDLSGSMLMKQNNAGNEQTIRMNEYPNGLYIVRIKTDNGTTVKKVKKN